MDLPTEPGLAPPGLEPAAVEIDAQFPSQYVSDTKLTYKSFKKKYKKIKFKFDNIMRISNELSEDEFQASEKARQLAQENDQLLELLLDTNNSHQMPVHKRIHLEIETPTPAISAVPSLITSEETEHISNYTGLPAVEQIYKDLQARIDGKAAQKSLSKPPKSFQHLLDTVPHSSSSKLPENALESLDTPEGYTAPIAYLTLDQIDEYLYTLDTELGQAQGPAPPPTTIKQDLAHRNPQSVYNWLRQHEPKVFLQDGEGSEKSQGKPGSLRGAGKRASMPFPSKPDALEIVEEDGLGYDPTIAGLEPATKGNKRKREDDGGYHPKLGAPDGKAKKPRTRKKKGDGAAESIASAGSARKAKGKGKTLTPENVGGAGGSEPLIKREEFAAASSQVEMASLPSVPQEGPPLGPKPVVSVPFLPNNYP